MARQEHETSQAPPGNSSRRWIPPLVGLGLLLLITIFVVFLRGPRDGQRAAIPDGFPPPEELFAPNPQDHGNPHGGDPHASLGHAAHAEAGTDKKVAKLDKPEGGQTIAELSSAPEKFSGRTVKVRGTIVKARQRVRPAPGAAPTNWYHVQDDPDGPLLLFTTADDLRTGDVVLLSGTLAVNKDFGAGLVYKLLLESPQVTRETTVKERKQR